MKKEDLRIVFMGTPVFAVESLKTLVENGYNIVGVITMPDKPAGRGYKLQPSPVKQYAIEKGLHLLQPTKLKNEDFLKELRLLKADVQIVVAFRMLPEVVWDMPSKGTFNLHSSLLPQYRGAAPINWAIINGEKETGVSTFFLSHEIDTGEIIFRKKTEISDTDNAETLHDRLMVMGAELVRKTVDVILEDNISAIPQNKLLNKDTILKPAPKIFTETCRIEWSKRKEDVYNFIRGLSPYPAAWTELKRFETNETLRVKIYSSEKIEEINSNLLNSLTPGSLLTDNKTFIDVFTGDGLLRITDLQLSGKKRMKTVDFLNGYKLNKNDKLI